MLLYSFRYTTCFRQERSFRGRCFLDDHLFFLQPSAFNHTFHTCHLSYLPAIYVNNVSTGTHLISFIPFSINTFLVKFTIQPSINRQNASCTAHPDIFDCWRHCQKHRPYGPTAKNQRKSPYSSRPRKVKRQCGILCSNSGGAANVCCPFRCLESARD